MALPAAACPPSSHRPASHRVCDAAGDLLRHKAGGGQLRQHQLRGEGRHDTREIHAPQKVVEIAGAAERHSQRLRAVHDAQGVGKSTQLLLRLEHLLLEGAGDAVQEVVGAGAVHRLCRQRLRAARRDGSREAAWHVA